MLVIIFSVISFYLLYMIGTSIYIPDNDLRSHSAFVVQALMALNENQFPIRIAPWEHQGLRYPEFQFYGVLFFTLAAYLYKFLHDPLLSLKCLLWITETIGGLYIYRLVYLFVKSKHAALIAATAYLFSPFLLLNISYRGDFPEAFGQGILPIALFYSFKILFNQTTIEIKKFFLASLCWFVLLTSHLITFAYGTLFFVITCGVFWLAKLTTIKRIAVALSANAYAWLLGAWFVVPLIALSPYTDIVSHNSQGLLMTSFYNLFTLHFNGSIVSAHEPGFYAAIGWPSLFGFVVCVLFLIISHGQVAGRRLIMCFTFLFLIAVLCAWSGINFWVSLPKFFSFGRAGFRFLTQIMWIGTILFGFSLVFIFGKQIKFKYIFSIIFLIFSINTAWLLKPQLGEKVSEIKNAPEVFYGSHDYMLLAKHFQSEQKKFDVAYNQAQRFCLQNNSVTECRVNLTKSKMVQLPVFYYPKMLSISLDGKQINYEPSNYEVTSDVFKQIDYNDDRDWMPYTLATVLVGPGEHTIKVKFTGNRWANRVSFVAWALCIPLFLI